MPKSPIKDFKEYLSQKIKFIDKTLAEIMPAENERPLILHSAMRYAVFSGGKRIRPAFCMAVCAACGGKEEKVLYPAISLELLHSYTLIHDDLPCMDNDVIRRGKPTVYTVFGEANALLAGDALQALAFHTAAITNPPKPYSPNQFVIELANAAGSKGVVGGQIEDLAAINQRISSIDMKFIHERKTAFLFRAASRIGAIAAGASSRVLKAMDKYGLYIGMIFQLTDDLLDEAQESHTFNYATIKGKKRTFREIATFAKKAEFTLNILPPEKIFLLKSAIDFIIQRIK